MHQIFLGYDDRQPISYTVLQQSIIAQTREPVTIAPLVLDTLPMTRRGLTPFTYSRFLVPHLCNYQGWALFLDVDIVLNGNIAELFAKADDKYAVMVSKNEHRFEWASVMLFNCAHPANQVLTPAYVDHPSTKGLHSIEWCREDEVGDLPREWNHLVGYDAPKDAKLVHFTQGVPAYPETGTSEYRDLWKRYLVQANHSLPWDDLMGQSVHSIEVNGRRMPKYLFDLEKQLPHPEHEAKVRELLQPE